MQGLRFTQSERLAQVARVLARGSGLLSDLSSLPTEELDKLISDRPESCRRPGKPGEPEAPVLTHATTVAMAHGCLAVSQLPPQPLMTLSLQSVPLHHQVQPQAHLAPDSPAPAQTPPLHALPDLSPSPLPHPAVGRAPVDFINISTDMNAEVDALDPSIMDFALQGEAGGMGDGKRGRGRSWEGEAGRQRRAVCIHPQLIPSANTSSHLGTAHYTKHFMVLTVHQAWPGFSQAASPLTPQQAGLGGHFRAHSTSKDTEAERRPRVTWLVSG